MTQRFSKMMSMNSNKRKGRTNPNNSKMGRSKLYSERNMFCDGIYGNSKVMYAGASLVGCVVQIQVQNGAVYEGVLRTFSHQLDIVLEMAHKVKSECPPTKGISATVSNLISSFPFEGGIYEKIIFKLSDIIMMQACSVDVDYATKDNFTDTAISKFNGQVKERELEPWEGAGSDSETPLTLTMDDEDGTNGWDANDMFRTNAEKYGVKSSYDHSLQEYTVPLTKKDTEEYKLQEAKALKIAQEIETNSCYQSRIQLENGDEEDRFSAVVRPTDETPSSKYVLPQKRRNVPGVKRQMTTSSSPVHVSSGKSSFPVSTQHVPSNIPNQAKQYPVVAPFPANPTNNGATEKAPSTDENVVSDPVHLPAESENVCGVSKMPVLCVPPPQPSLPPRIERRRENEKKLVKQKGRMDEIEDFKKFSKNFSVLTEEKEEPDVASSLERLKVEDEEEDKSLDLVKFSTLNPNAKEFVFNPNAKSFTPRSVPQPVLTQHVLPQPIFTQYVMQAPVSVALNGPFAQSQQNNRFRKASGPPPPLTVQYASPPGVLHASAPPQPAVGYPQMNFVVGPRVVSPQQVGVLPTSHAVSYCDVASHLPPAHLIMSGHTTTTHSLQQPQQQGQHSNQHHHHHHHHHHHPPQSQTPVVHPAPSPVHSAHHSQQPLYPQHPALHPHFPGGGGQPMVLMQQQHPLHAQQNGPLLSQMTIIPTSAPASLPYVQHP